MNITEPRHTTMEEEVLECEECDDNQEPFAETGMPYIGCNHTEVKGGTLRVHKTDCRVCKDMWFCLDKKLTQYTCTVCSQHFNSCIGRCTLDRMGEYVDAVVNATTESERNDNIPADRIEEIIAPVRQAPQGRDGCNQAKRGHGVCHAARYRFKSDLCCQDHDNMQLTNSQSDTLNAPNAPNTPLWSIGLWYCYTCKRFRHKSTFTKSVRTCDIHGSTGVKRCKIPADMAPLSARTLPTSPRSRKSRKPRAPRVKKQKEASNADALTGTNLFGVSSVGDLLESIGFAPKDIVDIARSS